MNAGVLLPALGREVEREHFPFAVEHPPDVPDDTLVEHALPAAESVGDVERAPREADRPRADTDAVVIVEEQHRRAAAAEIERRGEPDGAAANDDHRVMTDLVRILRGHSLVGVELQRRVVPGLEHGRHSPVVIG